VETSEYSVKQPEEMSYGEKRAKYLAEIADACKDLGAMVEKSLEEACCRLF